MILWQGVLIELCYLTVHDTGNYKKHVCGFRIGARVVLRLEVYGSSKTNLEVKT